jgi:cob(I)alamin adenosyltransferase
MKKGFIQVYTGNGKGKTTAALGLSMRAVGAGLKIYFCQFLKGQKSCETIILKKKLSENITISRSGRDSFVLKAKKSDHERAQICFKKASQAISSGKYDLIVLDEIFHATMLNLISQNELIELLKNKPENVEIILTGRNAPEEIIKIADLVTEMKEIKHYFKKNIKARKGIEF